MNRFGKLLRQMREDAKKTVPEVSEHLTELGFKAAPQTIYGWERGLSQPNPDLFLTMCKFYNVTDVLSYFGYHPIKKRSAPSISEEAMALATDYDRLDKWGRKQVRSVANIEIARVEEEQARAVIKAQRTDTEIAESAIIHIPFRCSLQSASAGTGTYLGPEAFETIYVQDNPLTRRASFGVPVSGNSMEPRYHDKDILILDGSEEIEPGEIGVFSIDGEGYVKELGNGELIPLNSAYDNIPLTGNIRCHGRVIGVLDPEWIVGE